MKSYLLTAVAILGLFATCYGQEPKKSNKDSNISATGIQRLMDLQIEAMKETSRNLSSLEASEKTLDSTFNAVLKEYAKDSLFVSRLTEAQGLWKKLRIADLKARFPVEEPLYYGQVYLDCVYGMLKSENINRTKFLNQWLVGIKEGDVCAGSLKLIR
ncbi:hypothetical protein [Pedobacter sp. GR22-6]|uniref:hypothetical protein n=1 Tax=Pedobacter sp. GR22-6 TaxID=3127957 RepID=UPI00307E5774